jgi:hypothetical protein
MTLSAIAKTTAAWAVGTAQGGIDTGAIANSTWYYFYAIRRPDTGVTDVIFSLSSSAPTLPANYTQYRYIGAGLTNGSAQWTKFYQNGDEFSWDVPVGADITTAAQGTTQISYTMSVPRGRVMKWLGSMQWAGAGNSLIIVGSPSQTLPIPSLANGDLYQTTSGATISTYINSLTNTSAQIAINASAASTAIKARTYGWIDARGRND